MNTVKVGDVCTLDKGTLIDEGYDKTWVDLVTKTEVVVLEVSSYMNRKEIYCLGPIKLKAVNAFTWRHKTYGEFKIHSPKPLVVVKREYIIL